VGWLLAVIYLLKDFFRGNPSLFSFSLSLSLFSAWARSKSKSSWFQFAHILTGSYGVFSFLMFICSVWVFGRSLVSSPTAFFCGCAPGDEVNELKKKKKNQKTKSHTTQQESDVIILLASLIIF